MKNKERYADEIMQIALSGSKVAIRNGKPMACEILSICDKCDLRGECKNVSEWAESEYEEVDTDLSMLVKDTPILVRNSVDENWHNRHFASIINGIIYTWKDGTTSWTGNKRMGEYYKCVTSWKYAKLPDEEKLFVSVEDIRDAIESNYYKIACVNCMSPNGCEKCIVKKESENIVNMTIEQIKDGDKNDR